MARSTGTHTKATATVTATANFTDNDTVIICGTTYRFKTTTAAANDVKIGGSLQVSLDRLTLALNGTGVGDGTDYHTGTVNKTASLVASNSATVLTLTARLGGSFANGFECREGVDVGAAFSVTRVWSGGAGAIHTFISDLKSTMNEVNSEVFQELEHVENAANGA